MTFLYVSFLELFCLIMLEMMEFSMIVTFIAVFAEFTQVMSFIYIFMGLVSLTTSVAYQQIFRNNTFLFVLLSNDNVYRANPSNPFFFILIFVF